jgi:hypothetical protein
MRYSLFIALAAVALATTCLFCGRPSAWHFGCHNATRQVYTSVTVSYNGQTFNIGQTGPGAYATATLEGDMPRAADIVLVTEDGTTHSVHVLIPEPPDRPPKSYDKSGIPQVYFIIQAPDKVDVTFDGQF